MMIVRELWHEAARFPGALAWSIALTVLVFGTHVAQAAGVAWAMSAVLGGQVGDVVAALGAVLGIALIRLLLSLTLTWTASRLGGRVRRVMRDRSMTAALTPDRLHDTTSRDGSVQATLSDGIDGTDAYVSKYVPAIAQVFIACPLTITLIMLLDPLAGLCVAAAIILALAGPMLWKKMMALRGLDHWDSYEALSADLLESLRGMGTVRTLGDVSGTRGRLHARSEALRRATERVMRVSLAETGVTDFAVQAGVVLAAMTAIVHAISGQPPALEIYLILLLSGEAFRPIRDLSRHWHAGFLGLTAIPGLTRLGAFTRHDRPRPSSPLDTQALDMGQPGALTVRGVTYRYPDADLPVLADLDLTATRGTLCAVVGASGAGKSTLFDVLLGFLGPQAGQLSLGPRPLRHGDIAVVSQRPVLFAGTIRDNLALSGDPTDAELVAVCRATGIFDEIQMFPDGLDSEIAEAGSSLSGGQRQRLALARALLAHRPVLLVDEPTSALDPIGAAEVIRTLHRVATERIVVMISHRAETLTDVDNVLRLESGQLVGASHE